MSELDAFVKELCNILRIKKIKIVAANEPFKTKTQIAETDLKKDIIYLSEKSIINHDTLFAVAHEIRHIWQFKNSYWHNIIEHHIHNDTLNTRDYNLQPEEIDANAFGTIVMIDLFGVKPLFKGLDKDIVKLIYERADEILAEIKKN